MLKISVKKSFRVCCVALLLSVGDADAVAKKKSVEHQKEYNGIVAVVNEDIITFNDLEDRVNMVLFSIGGSATPELKAKISREVLKEMIHEHLRWQCTKKYEPKGGWVPEDAIKSTFSDIAKRNNMESDAFGELLAKKNIDKDAILKQIKVNLAWIEYVKARFGRFINISESEINRTMMEVKEKMNQESFYVHRMFFPVSDPVNDKSVLSHVNNLNQMLARGADFAGIARQFSKSPDSSKGGEIGWVFRGQLSEEEDSALAKMTVGSRSVVRNSRGYVILFLQDKKEAGLSTFTDLKFVQIVTPFSSPNPSDEEVNRLMGYALDMKKNSPNARAMIQNAKDSGFCEISEPVAVVLESMQPQFRAMLSGIAAGCIGTPIPTPQGIVTICMLDKQTRQIKDPSPDDLKIQKMSERLSVFADRELQYLKKKSYMRINEKYGSQREFI
ncbi:MAG: peptidyl-prolyl cis-trans isomerase SurA [Holosporaceae bacterium]|jgi:peptidyl-prolyl cis-trans isomerase SurA|nr:peptidyl-prolyl cis-trans isomerase SurA [Holosporaceae bacterium]